MKERYKIKPLGEPILRKRSTVMFDGAQEVYQDPQNAH